jgi:TolB-like protein/DNA-binding winged helix-turn-helix (wHTH) protein/Tfp pilus assembly protein PilF
MNRARIVSGKFPDHTACPNPGGSDVATTVQSPGRLRFEGFEVDLDSGDVWKHGTPMRLQEQPFQVLRLLLERPGEIVTREELRQRLWPKTVVDFDDGLNTAIKKIRDVLGDSAERPRFIETIPRRGYRFIAPIMEAPSAPRTAARSRVARRWGIPALVAVIAALGVGAWIYQSRLPGAGPNVRSLAVLPFANHSGDAAQDYFAAGVTDALTTEIARSAGGALRVTSGTSAEKYKGKPLPEISRELGVDAVLQGSVTRSGSRVRVNAQLVDAREDKHLWAASYDRELHDVLGLQAEIAATVARRVHVKLDPRTETRLAAAAPVNPQAYDLYQRGRYRAFSNNPLEVGAAIELLEQALALEPNLAAAHALLARAYATQAFLARPDQEALETKALDYVSRALQLDPDLADAYLARGLVYWTHRNGFPHERAIREIKRALELDPNLAEAHHWLGTIFNHVGLLERGREELETALRLDPANAGIRYRIATTLRFEGKARDSLAGLEATRAFFPANAAYGIASALFDLGRKAEAEAEVANYLRLNPRDQGGVGHAMQALIHADAGRAELAEASIARALESGKGFGHFHHAAYTIGAAYAVMNRPREAVRWLRAAADDGFPCYPFYERDRALDKVRADEHFVQLMKDLRGRWDHYKSLS